MEEQKVDFESLEWQDPLPGARFKVFQRGNRRLRMVELAKGFTDPDWCSKGHIGYVLEGEMDVDFEGSIVRFSAGDGIFNPGEREE